MTKQSLLLETHKQICALVETANVDYSEAACADRNARLSSIMVSSMNVGWRHSVLGTNDDNAGLLLGMLYSFRPTCTTSADDGPKGALAWTDGKQVKISSAYIEVLEKFAFPTSLGRPISSIEKEIGGTLIHEGAHLFLNHPARMKRLIERGMYPQGRVNAVFQLAGDLLVETLGGSAIPDYTGRVTADEIFDELVPFCSHVSLSEFRQGKIQIEEVVLEVLSNLPPQEELPKPMSQLVPAEDADGAQQDAEVAASAAGNVAGVHDSAFQKMMEVPKPKFTIAQALTVQVTRASQQRSMRRMYPAFAAHRISLPAVKQEVGPIAVAVDTSGSMRKEDIKMALAEVNGVALATGASKIMVFPFATRVGEVVEYPAGSPIDEFNMEDRGGTSFNDVVRKINELHGVEDLAAAVILTDGYDKLSVTPTTDLIWGMVNDDKVSLPGQVIYL